MAKADVTSIGKKFHHLTIIGEAGYILSGQKRRRAVEVKCDCGVIGRFRIDQVMSGAKKTCGCTLEKNSWVIYGHEAKMYRDGVECIIDADDVDKVKLYTFAPCQLGYWNARINNQMVLMHRLLISVSDHEFVDHANGNPSDNRRCNLRICSRSQNQANRGSVRGSRSAFKGVIFQRGRWIARIGFEGKKYHIGTFKTEFEAAMAYDAVARRYHGEFAKFNFHQKE